MKTSAIVISAGLAMFVNGACAAPAAPPESTPRSVPTSRPPTAVPSREVARGKPAIASDYLETEPPGLAVDGKLDTWWGAGALPPHWIQIDLAFSPDGKLLASSAMDGMLYLWEVAVRQQRDGLIGPIGWAGSIAFSPDGERVASGSGDHTLRLWDAATGRETVRWIGHFGWVLSVAYSPDGEIVASAGPSSTAFWVAPGRIHLWDAESGYPYITLRGHTRRVTSVAFSADWKLLATGSADGSVRLWGVRR